MVDPAMLTEPVEPAYAAGATTRRLAAEAWDHLWPWSRAGFSRQKLVQAVGLALAVAVTTVWVLAGMGEMGAGALIGWWVGWSACEVLVRLSAKPYVKEGPWWGRRYRAASVMDMLCYVAFKNLLVGTLLFLTLKALGRVVV